MTNIKVYSTPTCPYCVMAKDFLKQNKVKFKDIDISKNQKAADEMVRKTHQYGVPVIEVDGKIIVGFDKDALKKALKL
jgi:glutaredoxin-like YruB-family protein